MSKDKIGERRETPIWIGESNEKTFIGIVSVLLVIALLVLGLFIWLGYPS